jgi:hypothetical protein
MGVIGLTVLSTAEVWDSSRCITEFPEGLRSREAYREGIHVFPLLLQSSDSFHQFTIILSYSAGSTEGAI